LDSKNLSKPLKAWLEGAYPGCTLALIMTIFF